jgi:AraC family transcriptional regulator
VTITGVQGTIVRSGHEPGIVCHEVLYDSGQTLEAHAHAAAFIAFTMNGRYRESACGLQFDCLPRSVVFHPAEEEHAAAVGDAPLRCFIVELDASEMRRRYDAAAPATLLKIDGGPMANVLTNLYGEFRHTDACSSLAIQGLILQLLAGLSRTDYSDGERVREPWVDRVTEILRDQFRSHLTLEEIAAAVGASPARVSAVFRRVYHRSIAEEQRRLRVEFACERLRDRDASLADIALEAGFSDQPHFSRAFKQVTGMTPARFRDAESR